MTAIARTCQILTEVAKDSESLHVLILQRMLMCRTTAEYAEQLLISVRLSVMQSLRMLHWLADRSARAAVIAPPQAQVHRLPGAHAGCLRLQLTRLVRHVDGPVVGGRPLRQVA